MPNTSLQRASIHKCTLLSLHNCQQKPANCFQFAGTNSLCTSASQLTTCSALICCVVLCCDMLCCVMLYCAVPCHAKPCHATSCNATPCHVPLVALLSWLLGQYHWYKSLMDLKRYISYVLHQNLWCYVAFLLTNAAQNLHSLLPTPHYNSI